MLFVKCSWVGWTIWALSIVAIALIVQFLITIRRLNILPEPLRVQIQTMFDERQYREVIELTETEPSFLAYMVHGALSDAAHGYPAMERAMEEAAEERTTKMLRSIEWLNLIGNVSPMLGLMGTVLGMIGAFMKIVETQQVDATAIAGPIGIALVTTLLGLGVAIPSLTFFAILRNRIDSTTSEAMVICQELISTFRPAGRG